MAIIGWLAIVIFISYITFMLGLVGLFGGEEFSPLSLKNYWWYGPSVAAVGWFWFWFISTTVSITV